ncbi:MAG: hypothetical protein ACLQOO_05920 [Terriglobia bacterium]
MFHGKFKVGDLVLDYSDKRRKWERKPIVHVLRIERVTPLFYWFHGYRPWRQKIERIDSHLVPISPDIPWAYRRTFSVFCELGEVGYRSRRWQVMEVGNQFPSRFEEFKDTFTGEVYRHPKDYSFKPCGYGLQEGNGDSAKWFWSENLIDIVRQLKGRAECVEREVFLEDDGLPSELCERGMVAWNGPAIQSASTKLKPGDFFAHMPFPGMGVRIDSFARPLESDPDEFVTTQGHVARFNALYEPPTAFPREVLERVQLMALALSFAEVRVRGAFTDTWPHQEKVLYYTNDGVRWSRKLSSVLQREIDRLVLTRSGGLPKIN